MKNIRGVLFCLMAASLIFLPGPGRANLSPIILIGAGGAASPDSPHDSIRMDAEQVTIRLKKTSYTVDAVFDFFNTGETTTEWVGFPKSSVSVGKSLISYPKRQLGHYLDTYDFIRFDAWVDGRKAEFSEERDFFRDAGLHDVAESKWMVKQVVFPGHAKTTIRIRYESPYTYTGLAYYVYGTGSFWKGKIGKAAFIIDSSEVGGAETTWMAFQASPGPRLISRNLVRYEIRDFEPWPRARLKIQCHRKSSSLPKRLP